jgi:hypothetical protein
MKSGNLRPGSGEMDNNSVVLVGQSHLGVFGLHRHPQHAPADAPPFMLKTIAEQPRLIEGISCLYPAQSQADGFREFCPGKTVIMVWRGGFHQAKFCVIAEPQFDFLLSDDPSCTVDPTLTPVPEAMVEEILRPVRQDLENWLHFFKGLGAAGPKRVIVSAVPPPKGDEDYLREKIKGEFPPEICQKLDDPASGFGVTKALTMLKIWKLMTRITKETALGLGAEFLDSVPECHDEIGFLKREYYSNDVTHANAGWGQLLLGHINKYLDERPAQ